MCHSIAAVRVVRYPRQMHWYTNVRGIITALVLLDNITQLNEHRSTIAAHFANAALSFKEPVRCYAKRAGASLPIELMPATTTAPALRWGRGRCWRTHSYPSWARRQASYSARAASDSG